MSFWAVVQSASSRESFAAKRVEQNGFEVFLPLTKVRITKTESRIVAVFPGYFFAHIIDRWRIIENTLGVIGLIMAGDAPAHCPAAEIERIKSAQMRNGLIKLPDMPKPPRHRIHLQAGDAVRILSGPFRGLDALYEGQTVRERELVLLELLGRRVQVELNENVQIANL